MAASSETSSMNNLILFATYWNEIDWIKPSLAQIERLDPMEVIICDGCFDESYPLHSTDGTREVIEKFVENRQCARLISPVRCARPKAMYQIWKGHAHSSWVRRLWPSRIRRALGSVKLHHYRINQGLTFSRMITLSQYWEPGRWFMTYDCDQFYEDETIERITTCVNSQKSDAELLTANERTFFCDFDQYTPEYEERNYNNMPHKIREDTAIYPTRALVIEGAYDCTHYRNVVQTKHVGTYNHYKLSQHDRFVDAYEVGDREMPEYEHYNMHEFELDHPSVIREHVEAV